MTAPALATAPILQDEAELEALKRKIERERGFNCVRYKDKLLRRRLAVRMRARGENGYAAYARLLDQDPMEYERLLDTLTINVSKFFRNSSTWDALEQRVLPVLFQLTGAVGVWSAGAAAGEEAYSVAMLLREWAERHGRTADLGRFRIVGTDIDRRSLLTAERGEYADLALTETRPDLRSRYFSPGPPYRLDETIRRSAHFHRRDLISAPPLEAQSLILCRNVVIYFEREEQERLFAGFCDVLRPGGFLVLGRVETLTGRARANLRTIDARERIFQKPS
ncbi:N/A [soil metagenome]